MHSTLSNSWQTIIIRLMMTESTAILRICTTMIVADAVCATVLPVFVIFALAARLSVVVDVAGKLRQGENFLRRIKRRETRRSFAQ